jgi:hypothetical protein
MAVLGAVMVMVVGGASAHASILARVNRNLVTD